MKYDQLGMGTGVVLSFDPASSQLDSGLFSMSVITPARELLLALARNIIDTE